MVEIVYLYAESIFGPTIIVLSNGEHITINKELEIVLEDILHLFGGSLEINKTICKDIFGFNRLVPIICSVRNALYFVVSDKLSNDDVYVINPFYIKKTIEEGDKLLVYLQNEILTVNISKYSFDKQLKRIKQIREFYGQSYVNLYEYFNEEENKK